MVLTLSDGPIPALPDFAHVRVPNFGDQIWSVPEYGRLAPDCARSTFTLSARYAWHGWPEKCSYLV